MRTFAALVLAVCALQIQFGCSSSSSPAQASGMGKVDSTKWRAVVKHDRERLLIDPNDPGDWPTYVSLWDVGAERKRVEIELGAGELFGVVWYVRVIGGDGREEQRGEVRSGQESIPYCLATVRSNSDRLPSRYRGRDALAIVFTDRNRPFDEKKPLAIFFDYVPDDSSVNWLSMDPVRWDVDKDQFQFGVGILNDDAASVEYRSAESTVTLSGTKLVGRWHHD